MKTALLLAGGFVAGVVFLFVLEVAAVLSSPQPEPVTFQQVYRSQWAQMQAAEQRSRRAQLDRQLQVQRARDARRRPGDVCVSGTLVRRSVVNGVPTVQQDMANSDLCK